MDKLNRNKLAEVQPYTETQVWVGKVSQSLVTPQGPGAKARLHVQPLSALSSTSVWSLRGHLGSIFHQGGPAVAQGHTVKGTGVLSSETGRQSSGELQSVAPSMELDHQGNP